MKKGKLIIFVGPTGSGKTSLIKRLVSEKKLNLIYVPTYTTREPRFDEINGKDCYFLDRYEFFKKKENGFFLETFCLNENYYGTSKETLDLLNNGKNIIKSLDSSGFIEWKKRYKYVFGVFIDVNDKEIIKRINFRNEKIREDFLRERMKKGINERKVLRTGIFDKFIFNFNFDKSFFEIKDYLEMVLILIFYLKKF